MTEPIDSRVSIGHVHLKVADLNRALGFYRDMLGFQLMQRMGSQAAFLSAGGYHHHLGLNTWESRGGTPPPPGNTGLYHVALPGSTESRRCLPAPGARRRSPRWRGRPRGQRSPVPSGPRRQWRGVVLGPPARAVASHAGRRSGHVHHATGSRRSPGRVEVAYRISS